MRCGGDTHLFVLLARAGELLAVEQDFPCGRFDQAKNCPPDRGLPTAALTHQAKGLPLLDEHIDIIDRLDVGHRPPQDPLVHGEVLLQVPHFKQYVFRRQSL